MWKKIQLKKTLSCLFCFVFVFLSLHWSKRLLTVIIRYFGYFIFEIKNRLQLLINAFERAVCAFGNSKKHWKLLNIERQSVFGRKWKGSVRHSYICLCPKMDNDKIIERMKSNFLNTQTSLDYQLFADAKSKWYYAQEMKLRKETFWLPFKAAFKFASSKAASMLSLFCRDD